MKTLCGEQFRMYIGRSSHTTTQPSEEDPGLCFPVELRPRESDLSAEAEWWTPTSQSVAVLPALVLTAQWPLCQSESWLAQYTRPLAKSPRTWSMTEHWHDAEQSTRDTGCLLPWQNPPCLAWCKMSRRHFDKWLWHTPSTPHSPGSEFAASVFTECRLPAVNSLFPGWDFI